MITIIREFRHIQLRKQKIAQRRLIGGQLYYQLYNFTFQIMCCIELFLSQKFIQNKFSHTHLVTLLTKLFMKIKKKIIYEQE